MFLLPSPTPSVGLESVKNKDRIPALYEKLHYMFKKYKSALAGVAQWIKRWPVNRKAFG